MALHDLPLPKSCRGAVRFLQLPSAVITTDLDGLAADFDFEGIFIQLAVASCTSRFNHDVALPYPKSGHESSRPRAEKIPLSESLAICRKRASDEAPTGGILRANGRKFRGKQH
jgi:hypothetical protein